MKRFRSIMEALYRLYEHSGFTLAGAVAFAFVVSIFPFCIFLGALSGVFGGRELATQAIAQLFDILPRPVAEGLAPEVQAIMGTSRIDLLTVSGFLALFFATSAIETMRTALNSAYRVHETRSYPLCLLISMLFVFVSAVSTLFLTWAVVVGPVLAERFQPEMEREELHSDDDAGQCVPGHRTEPRRFERLLPGRVCPDAEPVPVTRPAVTDAPRRRSILDS